MTTILMTALLLTQTLPAGYWPLEKSQPLIDKTQTIRLSGDMSKLSDGEKKAVAKLIEAGQIFQKLYEEQRHPEALSSYRALEQLDKRTGSTPATQNLLTLYRLFQGPVATNLENKREAFLPIDPTKAGKNVYPWGITKEQIGQALALPSGQADKREKVMDLRTVEQESEQFEDECFAQDEWPAELDAAEHDLIDAYLRNELTADRKRRFEERYLTTDARKARVLATKSFHELLCPAQPKVTWRAWLPDLWQRPLVPQTAIAILLLAVGIGIFLPRFLRQRPQTFTPIELAMSTSNRATGIEPQKVSLPLSTDALRISLKLPQPSPDTTGYRVQWENINGGLVDLKIESQDAQSVVVIIPAAELTPGKYLLKLSKANDVIGNYYFNTEARPR